MKSERMKNAEQDWPSAENASELPSDHSEKQSQSEADYDYFTKLAEEARLSGDHEHPSPHLNQAVPLVGKTDFSTHTPGRAGDSPSSRPGEQRQKLAGLTNESLSTSDIWAAALLPQTDAYIEILKDPNAGRGRAYAWMAVAGAATYGFSMVIQILFGFLAFQWPGAAGKSAAHLTLGVETSVGITLAGLPVSAAAAVISMTGLAGLYQLLARILGGRGTLSMMVYALSAFLAPVSIATGIIAAIPYVNVALIPIGLYTAVLTVTAVRTVNRLSWWKASLVVIIIPSLICAGLFILAAAALRSLAPQYLTATIFDLYRTILPRLLQTLP